MPNQVKEHKSKRRITEVVIYPEHEPREESRLFRKNKERLIEDGHFECWVCGSTENLQVHHYGCEWSLENVCDFKKLKEFLEEWDPYGYSKTLKKKPIECVDDIRNMMVLCREHHIEVVNGIHQTTFPIWIIQKLAKKGEEPVPDDNQ